MREPFDIFFELKEFFFKEMLYPEKDLACAGAANLIIQIIGESYSVHGIEIMFDVMFCNDFGTTDERVLVFTGEGLTCGEFSTFFLSKNKTFNHANKMFFVSSGEPVKINKSRSHDEITGELQSHIDELSSTVNLLKSAGIEKEINLTASGEIVLDEFDGDSVEKARKYNGTMTGNLWGAAGMKALKFAGMLAVSRNMHNPLITETIAYLAVKYVKESTEKIISKLKTEGTEPCLIREKQRNKIEKVISEYLIEHPGNYGPNVDRFHSQKIIPRGFLQNKLASYADFRKDPDGSTFVIHRILNDLCGEGVLSRVTEDLGTRAVIYRINEKYFVKH